MNASTAGKRRVVGETLSAIRPRCLISVGIPAKNEAAMIGDTLAALSRQCALDGTALDPDVFEVLVFANDCTDDTAHVVAAFAAEHARFAVHVVSGSLPQDAAHVGSARRFVLDVAHDRQRSINGDAGIIASTDADSCADRLWIAQTLAEMRRVDAVAGHVEIASAEREAMPEPLRRLYDRERYHRRLVGQVEALFDPRPFDPPPRHDAFVGASFAVRNETYEKAGRSPILRHREDDAFAYALRRIDARIRHAYEVRLSTSGRAIARVVGGFGSYIDYLRDRSANGETHRVNSGLRSILRAKTRGILRTYWASPTDAHILDEIAWLFRMSTKDLASFVDPSAPFGETLDRLEATSIPFEGLPEEPIEAAISAIEDAITAGIVRWQPVQATCMED